MSDLHKKQSRHADSHENDEHVFVKKHLENKDQESEKKDQHHKSKEHDHTDKKSFFRYARHSHEEEKHTQKEIVKNLTAIYQNQDGSLPDMKNFQKSRRVRIIQTFFTLIFGGLFFVALAFGIMYFTNSQKTGSEDFVVTISSPEEVKIGGQMTFRIRYRNPQSVPISQAVMNVRYPEGFVFVESSQVPTNDEKTEWKLGVLGAEAEGYIDITGKIYGSLYDKESLRVFFNYLPANFNSEFQKIVTQTFTLSDSAVKIILKAPNNAIYGSNIPLDVVVIKDSNFTLDSLSLVLDGKDEFVKKVSEPLSDAVSDTVWSLDPKITTSTIKIQGAFLSLDTATTTDRIVFQVLGYKTPQKTGKPLILAEQTYLPQLTHTALETKITVNGSMADGTIIPGENINTTIVVKNTGQTPLKNIEVAAIFEAPSIGKQSILDWKAVQDANDGTITAKAVGDTRRQAVLTWNGKQISELKSLDPGKEVHIDVILPLKKNQNDADKYKSWNITVNTEAKYDAEKDKNVVTSNPINLLINSDLSLEVRNDVSASANNVHNVTWLLTNTYHPLKDIEAFVEVYGDTRFDDAKLVVPAGKAVYETDKKIIRWTIPQMPVGVDVNALQFTLIADKQNLSQTQLTSKVTVHAIDTVTQKEIIMAGDEILANVQTPPERNVDGE